MIDPMVIVPIIVSLVGFEYFQGLQDKALILEIIVF